MYLPSRFSMPPLFASISVCLLLIQHFWESISHFFWQLPDGHPRGRDTNATYFFFLFVSPQEKKSMSQPSKDLSSSATTCPWTRFKAAVMKSHCHSKPYRGMDWCCTRANQLITSTWHWKMGLSHSSLIWGLEPLKLLWSQSMGNLMTMIGMMSK